MQTQKPFPLRGVIGVVANSADEINQAVARKLQCVEIRADLLLDAGLSIEQLLDVVKTARTANLATLFTLRHPSHGGRFPGSEDERAIINRQALSAGADIIDLEWDADASAVMIAEGAPVLLSYHDFNTMPDDSQLAALTAQMCSASPLGIKIVPTASTLTDSLRMLLWARAGTDSTVHRVGFAMGPIGRCSRILTTAFGAPITYASFGEAVAPGQVAIDALLDSYRVPDLNGDTRVVAVVGDTVIAATTADALNRDYAAAQQNTVAIPFPDDASGQLEQLQQQLRVSEIRQCR